MISRHQPDVNARVNDCAQSIERMLDTCNTQHITCKVDDIQQRSSGLETSRFIPKRLLSINNDDPCLKVLLCESESDGTPPEGKDLRYTALSHCWGSTPIIETTAITVSAFKTGGINWTSLPKTFQEAILLTHELGIHYIWIDSLCKHPQIRRHLATFTK